MTASRDGLAFSGHRYWWLPGSGKALVNRRTAEAKATCDWRRIQYLRLAQALHLRCIDSRLTLLIDSVFRELSYIIPDRRLNSTADNGGKPYAWSGTFFSAAREISTNALLL